MFSAGEVLLCASWGEKEIQNAPKITKNGKLKAITFIHLILLKLDQKPEITNKYATGPRSTLEKLNFALQLKAPCGEELL